MNPVREIFVNERDFADEAQLCTYLAGELGGCAGDMAELTDLLLRADRKTRIAVRHEAFDDPVEEVLDFEAIEAASHGSERQLDWFDAACAVLEQVGRVSELVDVIVYFDDLSSDEPNDVPEGAGVSSAVALARLRQGNLDYLTARKDNRNISAERIRELYEGGQRPYAVVLTCSDSRVVPEHIFMAGLGELFVVRVAGNVVGESELASAVYACEHLSSKLLLVLGHTHCGAIEAAMAGGSGGAVAAITSRICEVIGGEHDPYVASVLNVRAAIAALLDNAEIAHLIAASNLEVHGAIYHTHSGVVDFLEA